MKTIFKILFICYWGLTFLYVIPENFVQIKSKSVLQVFSAFCEQKWGFFAPPPKGTHRLYYTFFDNQQNAITTYEVTKPLLMEKKRKKPWNTREEALDYIVNGSIINLIDFIVTQKDIYRHLYPDSTDIVIEKKARLAVSERHNQIPAFISLTRYGKIVADKNFTEAEYGNIESFKISITYAQLPKFIDRAKLLDDTPLAEGLLLETPMIPFKNKDDGLTLYSDDNQQVRKVINPQ